MVLLGVFKADPQKGKFHLFASLTATFGTSGGERVPGFDKYQLPLPVRLLQRSEWQFKVTRISVKWGPIQLFSTLSFLLYLGAVIKAVPFTVQVK